MNSKVKYNHLFGSALFVILNLSSNFLNYFSNIVIAWKLPFTDYGKIMAIFSMIVLFAIPTQMIQTYVSNHTASGNKDLDIVKIFVYFAFSGIALALVLLVFFPYFASVLDISLYIYILMLVNTVLVFPVTVTRGFLQGHKRFLELGISFFMEVAIKCALIAGVLTYASASIPFVLTSIVVSVFLALIYNIFRIKELHSWDILRYLSFDTFSWSGYLVHKHKKELRHLFSLFLGIAGVFLLVNIDIILIAKVLPAVSSEYAIYTRLGQIIFMGGSIFISLCMPFIVTSYSQEQSTKAGFFRGFFAISFCSTIALIIYYFFSHEVVLLLFHKTLIESKDLFYVGFSYTLIVLSFFITQYFLSLKKYSINYSVWIALVMYIVMTMLFHTTLSEFIFNFLSAGIAYFVISTSFLLYFKMSGSARIK